MADEHETYEAKPDTYSAASEVARNIIELFRMATRSRMDNNLKSCWIYLEEAYIEADFIFKEKERERLLELWKKINPNEKKSYGLLKEYTLELRRLCKSFFLMIGDKGDPRTAVYRQ